MKKIFFTFLFIVNLCYVWGQSTMPSDAIDLTSGSLYLNDGSYAVGSSSGSAISHTRSYNIYTSGTTSNVISIQSGAQTLNLWKVNILNRNSTADANQLIDVKSGANLDINLHGLSTMNTWGFYAAICYEKATASTTNISGDSLNIIASVCGIGNPDYTSLQNIDLILGCKYLKIDLLNDDNDADWGVDLNEGYMHGGSAIGASNNNMKFKSLTFQDGCVFTSDKGNYSTIGANTITIGKSSVKVFGTTMVPVNGNGEKLYCVTVPRNGAFSVTVKNNTTAATEDYSFSCAHPNDDNYYLWLPNGSYTLTSNGYSYTAVVNGTAVTAALAPIVGDGNIDVSTGNVSIYDGGYQIGIQSYTYTGKVYSLTGTTTTNTVSITAGADTVKLNGVDIEPSAGCSLNINTGADIIVVLNDGTTNTLKSFSGAGLQKSQTNGMLTIKGKGILIASSSGGPGIGSASSACSNITIEEGTINASTSALTTAAIGTGKYNCSNIFIKGGNITATTYYYAYAIGSISGGYTISNIQISGGKVQLYSGNKMNVNNYLLPSNTTVTGGTITGQITEGIKGTLMGSGSVITGGSVTFADATGNFSIATASHPTNGTTTDYLYRSQFLVPGIKSATSVSAISVDGKDWGCTDLFTNDSGMVYLWLPKDDASAYETTKVIITVGDKTYTYVGQIDALDNIIEASGSVAAQGNFFYQVPVIITTKNATATIADADSKAINNGNLLCSGQLDDNKPRLTIAATADENYNAPVLSYTNLSKGTKYYMVTAGYADTVKITATATIKSFPVTFQAVHGAVAVVAADTSVLSGELVNYGTLVSISTTPDEHYQFDSLLVNGGKVTDGTYTITSDATITGYFSPMKFPVSFVATNGTITVTADGKSISSEATVDYGTEITIAATPDEGYRLDTLKVNGNDAASGGMLTVTSDVTVSAVFSKIATGTTSLSENTTQVYAYAGAIYVKTAIGSEVNIYSISGRLVSTGNVTSSLQSFVVPSGTLYMVKISYANTVKTTKCLVY